MLQNQGESRPQFSFVSLAKSLWNSTYWCITANKLFSEICSLHLGQSSSIFPTCHSTSYTTPPPMPSLAWGFPCFLTSSLSLSLSHICIFPSNSHPSQAPVGQTSAEPPFTSPHAQQLLAAFPPVSHHPLPQHDFGPTKILGLATKVLLRLIPTQVSNLFPSCSSKQTLCSSQTALFPFIKSVLPFLLFYLCDNVLYLSKSYPSVDANDASLGNMCRDLAHV